MAAIALILVVSEEQTGGKVAAAASADQLGFGKADYKRGVRDKRKEVGPKPGQEDWATEHSRSRSRSVESVGDVAPST